MNSSIEQRLSELEARVAKLETATSSPEATRRPAAQKRMSAREFLLTKNIKSELQKTLALAYYLEVQEGMPSFNITDLMAAFQAAKEARPGNLSDTVGKNVARGFLMDTPERKDGKKAWTLTATGERCVEGELKK
ncbi:MAG: hypothetical protein NUV84_02260 [Candidatus Uhrbacteria bacterium]|nr:hypothetical protein [Candidatus Uhrbacteria bacterium]